MSAINDLRTINRRIERAYRKLGEYSELTQNLLSTALQGFGIAQDDFHKFVNINKSGIPQIKTGKEALKSLSSNTQSVKEATANYDVSKEVTKLSRQLKAAGEEVTEQNVKSMATINALSNIISDKYREITNALLYGNAEDTVSAGANISEGQNAMNIEDLYNLFVEELASGIASRGNIETFGLRETENRLKSLYRKYLNSRVSKKPSKFEDYTGKVF